MLNRKILYSQFNTAMVSMDRHMYDVEHTAEDIFLSGTQSNDDERVALAMLLYGMIRFAKGNHPEALNYYSQCEKILDSITSNYHRALFYKAKGDCLVKSSNYVEALLTYFASLSLFVSDDDLFGIQMKVYSQIGHIYMQLEVFSKAYTYLKKAEETAEQQQNFQGIEIVYAELGYCMVRTGQKNEALEWLDLASRTVYESGDPDSEAYVIMTYGLYYNYISDFANAHDMLDRAFDYYAGVNNVYWQGKILSEKGEIFLKEKQYREAENCLLRCQLLIMSRNYRSLEIISDGLLAKLYEVSGSVEKAVSYYHRYYELKEAYDKYWQSVQVDAIAVRSPEEDDSRTIKELEHDKLVLKSLSTIGKQLTATFDIDKIIHVIRENIFNAVQGDKLIIGIRQGDEIQYTIFGRNMRQTGATKYDDLNNPIARFMHHRQITVLEDVNNNNHQHSINRVWMKRTQLDKVTHLMSSPLIHQKLHLGTIIIGREEPVSFTISDKEAAGLFSDYIAIAIQNSYQSMELMARNKQLKDLMERDGLTKAYNRHALSQHMNEKRHENKPMKALSVVMLDIDYFKEFNDHYGHQEGDRCLTTVSSVMEEVTTRVDGTLYRYGGDEFMLVVYNMNAEEVVDLCENVRLGVISRRLEHEKSKVNDFVTLTIGVATVHKGFDRMKEIISLADKALYRAKGLGRNNVQQIIKNNME